MLARQGTTVNATMHINQHSAASNPWALTDRFSDGIVRRLAVARRRCARRRRAISDRMSTMLTATFT
ncbi:hypothetical protein [Streptomyces sp. NPDC048665]|uniref:hypothetical protein n=1 Tax=Streptomyces sp. NPDC048665 TaxID=3155490 RepID=UPI0034224CA8